MLTLRTSGTITDIKNKITSPSFQNAKIGDHIEFSMPIKRTDGNDPYTTCINCPSRNLLTFLTTSASQTIPTVDNH